MYSDDPALKELTKDECLQLLASVPVGRIIFTRRALPAAELVNFTMDHGDIVIRTDRGDNLASAVHKAVVAFEADGLDPVRQTGWSVIIVGRSQEVTDPGEIGRLEQLGLSSWAPGEREHFIRISPEILNGRWLRAHGHVDGCGTRDAAESQTTSASAAGG